MTVRKTGGRDELDAIWTMINALVYRQFAAQDSPALANGATAGKIKTVTSSTTFRIDGVPYAKAATDDLWDLSAETDTDASSYRAYWLYIDASGVASIAAGDDRPRDDLALKALPNLDPTLSVFGVFVAGPSCNFNGAGGLSAQGDLYNRVPAGVPDASETPEITHLVAP